MRKQRIWKGDSMLPQCIDSTLEIGDLLQIGAKYLLRIHLNLQRAVIGMNSPLPFLPCDAKTWDMAQNGSARHPLFRQRWFADEVILTCVRWYLRFKRELP